MSHNKAINSGSEHRKPYKGSKAWDHTCRNHGSCSYCGSNRLHQFNKAKERVKYEEDGLLTLEESSIPENTQIEILNRYEIENLEVDYHNYLREDGI